SGAACRRVRPPFPTRRSSDLLAHAGREELPAPGLVGPAQARRAGAAGLLEPHVRAGGVETDDGRLGGLARGGGLLVRGGLPVRGRLLARGRLLVRGRLLALGRLALGGLLALGRLRGSGLDGARRERGPVGEAGDHAVRLLADPARDVHLAPDREGDLLLAGRRGTD